MHPRNCTAASASTPSNAAWTWWWALRGDARYIVDEVRRAGLPAHFFEDSAAAGEFVRELIRPGDAVLFKGSRGVQVERALEKVMA